MRPPLSDRGAGLPDDALDLALGVVRTVDDQNPGTRAVAGIAGLTWRFR